MEAVKPAERRTLEAVTLSPAPAIDTGGRAPRQAALFREGLRIVPAPQPERNTTAPPKQRISPRHTARAAADPQQYLAFGPVVTHSRPSDSEIRFEIHNGHVAATSHRAFAAFVDSAILATAYGVMVAIFTIWGRGTLSADPTTIAVAGTMAVLLVMLYQLFWVLGDGDTPGLQLARLYLVDFDGRPATRKARLFRAASSWLSLAPGGLGLLWALLDEEALTWHDQISKTFPSPARPLSERF